MLLSLAGCYVLDAHHHAARPPRGQDPRLFNLETTGYCSCGSCCGWKRNWYGRPVIASGPQRGKPKHVGETASGTQAHPGTLAADTSKFPFGTIMYIPGYGYGKVEDCGGAIKGYHVDLYFKHHRDAKEWGRKRQKVKVWLP